MNSMILLCAGAGSRVGLSLNKLLLKHENKMLAQYTLENIFSSNQIDELIIVVKNSEIEIFKNILSEIRHTVKVKFASGGETRFESVKNGLLSVDPESDYLLIHDCARPFINNKIIKILLNNIDKDTPGAIPFLSCSDTIKEKEKNIVKKTLNRNNLIRIQTPQVFITKIFKDAISKIPSNNIEITDDSSILEYSGYKVKICKGYEKLFKITTIEDWEHFCEIIDRDKLMYRIGQGYDIHRKNLKNTLIIGGVKILNEKGLEGHSDADVLIHAIIDSLLGAAGLSDIGTYFPDTDIKYKNISSLTMLKKVSEIIEKENFVISNIDTTVIAQSPKLIKYIPEMKTNISKILKIKINQIGIKAKTNEKLDAVGNDKAIIALSTALIVRRHCYAEEN